MTNRILQTFSRRCIEGIAASIALSALTLLTTTVPALSAPLHPAPAQDGVGSAADVVEIRAVVRRGGVAVGPRGNVAAYRSRTVVRGPAVRPGYRGAIAAGAAIGMVTAATAAAWAGAAPAPGMCWYYTDPSRTQGFWDYCR